MAPSVDKEEIARFVSAIFRYADEGTWASLRVFDEHRKDVAPVIQAVQINGDASRFVDAAVKMAEMAARRSRPSVFAPPAATFNNPDKAREQDLACAVAACVELDHKSQDGLEELRGVWGRPTVVVESGGRWTDDQGRERPKLHAYWRYSEAAVGNDILLSKKLRTAATQLVGGDPTNYPDSHPIRWPGSVHRKGEPIVSRITELNEGAEIHLGEALERIEEACRRKGTRVSVAPGVKSQVVEPAIVGAAKFASLMENSREFKRAWSEGYKTAAGMPDHSQCDWWLGLEAARAGWTDEEIAGLIVEFRTKVGEGGKATPAYLGHTISKIRHALATGRNMLDDGLYVAEQAVDQGDGGGAITALGHRLGVPLAKIIITGIDTAVAYWFELKDGRRIGLGDAACLLSQQKVRQRVLAAATVVMSAVKQHEWDNVVRMMLAVAEREEAADSDPIREVASVLAEYAEQFLAPDWKSEHADGDFEKNRPLTKDGRFLISPREFMRWAQSRGALLSYKLDDLRTTLRGAGWSGEDLTRRIGVRVKCRVYWSKTLHKTEPDQGDRGV